MEQDLTETCREIVASCACEALRRTSRAVAGLYQDNLRGSGVRAAQLPILVATHLAGPVPVGALATTLVMDRTTLTRNLKGLCDQGLVRMESEEDRRIRLVVLTEKGREALAVAVGEWRRAHDNLVTGFGAERVRRLVAELAAVTRFAET